MDIDNAQRSVFKTHVGRDVYMELLELQWDNTTAKQIDIKGISFSTTKGLKRARNEDRYAVCVVSPKPSVKYFLAVICDGVGSSKNGHIAATIVIASLVEELLLIDSPSSLKAVAEQIILKTDYKVRLALEGSGLTTLSVVLARYGTNEVIAANVGDSRVYSWRPLDTVNIGSVEQISIDDTFDNEFKYAGYEDADVLDAHGLRGVLSQAIGDKDRGDAPLEVNTYGYNLWDITGTIIATDGAWKAGVETFKKISSYSQTSLEVVRRLPAYANWIGGVDNTSIIAIEDFNFLREDLFIGSEVDTTAKAILWCHDVKFTHTYDVKTTDIRNENTVKSKARAPRAPRKGKLKQNQASVQLKLEGDAEKDVSPELKITSK